MKILLDQGLPRLSAQALRDAGVDAVHTGECGLSTASDSEILATAREQGRIVISLDSDFHRLMALSGAVEPSVVRIRQEGLRAEAAASLILSVLRRGEEALRCGALVSVTFDRIRLRHLPLERHRGDQ